MSETNPGYEVRVKLSKSNAGNLSKHSSFDITQGKEIGELLRTGKTVSESYDTLRVLMDVFTLNSMPGVFDRRTLLSLRIFNHENDYEIESSILLTTDTPPVIKRVTDTRMLASDKRNTPYISFDVEAFAQIKTLKELTEKINEMTLSWVNEKSAKIGGFPESI